MKKKTEEGLIKVTDPSKTIIGIAARHIKKDELITYSPYANTKDILMPKKPSREAIEKAIIVLQSYIRKEHAKGSVCITTALCNRLKEAD